MTNDELDISETIDHEINAPVWVRCPDGSHPGTIVGYDSRPNLVDGTTRRTYLVWMSDEETGGGWTDDFLEHRSTDRWHDDSSYITYQVSDEGGSYGYDEPSQVAYQELADSRVVEHVEDDGLPF
jgi:hypothetical protein